MLRAEHRLRAFYSGMPRKIFGPKSDEVKDGCKKTA
jgi:hypothetical protein